MKNDSKQYDFKGWATRAGILCSDGRVIMPNAFADQDGKEVPIVYNHRHNSVDDVLGHGILENREEGVYFYGTFNDTESGKTAKQLVAHGDVKSLSIYANQLKQQGPNVIHGNIREVSLVLAGANPGANIESVYIAHGDDEDTAALIDVGSDNADIELSHSDDVQNEETTKVEETTTDEETTVTEDEDVVEHADGEGQNASDTKKKSDDAPTLAEVINSMTDVQKGAVEIMMNEAVRAYEAKNNKSKEGDTTDMKHNVFEQDAQQNETVLSHADGVEIVSMAKTKKMCLKDAMAYWASEQGMDTTAIAHGFDTIDVLFPEYQMVTPTPPELITRDQGWITAVLNKTHKSPYTRIRTRYTDIREMKLALGYNDRSVAKKDMDLAKFIGRTTDAQTVYIKDKIHRDDIIDIKDFDIVNYQYQIMKLLLNETLATAILVGDGRDELDPDKIHQEHIRAVWLDNDVYTLHYPVMVDGDYTQEIQDVISLGGDVTDYTPNYQYTEAILAAALLSREKYKGTGKPDFYCDPHLINIMLLARDLNGRRIYDSESDLAKALNVGAIYSAEQFQNKYRFGSAETEDADKKYKLLGLFVNLADYTIGHTRGGEITKFEDFDIDFNQYTYMLETRLSGALIKIRTAIALEEVTTIVGGGTEEPEVEPGQ